MCVHRTKEDSEMYTKELVRRRSSRAHPNWRNFPLKGMRHFLCRNHIILTVVLLVPICSAVPLAGNNLAVKNEPEPLPLPLPGQDASKTAKPTFFNGFISSLSMIIVSELGDKTFFIAAIMAMRHSRVTVFAGAITALGLMTILSALFGFVTTVIPRVYTYYISTALFGLFGFKMLYDGCQMSDDEGAEELEEVQQNLRQLEADENTRLTESIDSQAKSSMYTTARRILFTFVSRVYLQALTMTFLAEWGDRSQLATVVLAARENILGICVGGVLGHSLCTGLAVLGGRLIAQKISVKTVTIVGGIVFLIFAIISLFLNPNN